MLDLIQIELARVRKMAEQADDGFLLYLIDMVILEANQKTGAGNNKAGTPALQAMQLVVSHDDQDFA